MVPLGTCTAAEIKIGVYTHDRLGTTRVPGKQATGGLMEVLRWGPCQLTSGFWYTMPGGVELGAETDHDRTSRPVHQGRCSDAARDGSEGGASGTHGLAGEHTCESEDCSLP